MWLKKSFKKIDELKNILKNILEQSYGSKKFRNNTKIVLKCLKNSENILKKILEPNYGAHVFINMPENKIHKIKGDTYFTGEIQVT